MARENFVENNVERVVGMPRNMRTKQCAALFCRAFHAHFKELYDEDKARGKARDLPYLSSTQSALSRFRKRLKQELRTECPEEFLKGLALCDADHKALAEAKRKRREERATNLLEIHAEPKVLEFRHMLNHSTDPREQLVALAALTGRRCVELLRTGCFRKPRKPHQLSEQFWTSFSGVAKQPEDKPLPPRELPLLAPRREIIAAVARVREALPSISNEQMNAKYAKGISRTVKRVCAEVGTLHAFRKFYAFTVLRYFNEKNASTPLFVSDVLGHKNMSDTVLTYLSFDVRCDGTLAFHTSKK